MNTYLNSIITLFKSNLNEIKTVDYFNNQYNSFEKIKAIKMPSVFIEFDDNISWHDLSNGKQLTETEINFHIVIFDLSDSPQKLFDLSEKVHKLLQGNSLYREKTQLSTGFSRTKSQKINKHTQIKILKLSYKTCLFDYSAVKQKK